MRINTYNDPLTPDVQVRVRDQWISDQTYHEMVQKSVICCTDAILLLEGDSNAVYLGKRSNLPMQGIWCLGGRVFFNDDTLEASVSRCVEIETGLRIDPCRYQHVTTNLYSWVKVAQGDFPGKNFAPLYQVTVSAAELAQMAHGLKQAEYDRGFGLQRFDRQRLVDERVHPAMLDAFDLIFSTM